MTSVPCAHPSCRRMTRSTSGRCHDHTGPLRASSAAPALPLDPAPKRAPGDPVTFDYEDGTSEIVYGDRDAPHRIDGPAVTTYRPDGSVKEEWFEEGRKTRSDGPAEVNYLRDGSVERELWFRDGDLHRLDGPANVYYRRDGSVSVSMDYVLGNYAIGGFGDEFERIGPERTRDAIDLSPFADLVVNGTETAKIAEAIGAGVRTAEGVREVLGGAPAEWVCSWEEARS